LLTAKRYEEAVLLFRKCEDWESVLKCHELGRNYKGYIEIATAITHTSKEDIAKTLERMALSFETTNDFATVAEIYRHVNIDVCFSRLIILIMVFRFRNIILGLSRIFARPHIGQKH
jgi:hypothetical protein